MNRVGIFVGPDRLSGGSFQYCLGLLEACAKIRSSDLDFVVACTSKEWIDHANRLGFRTLKITISRRVRMLHRLLTQAPISLTIFRSYLYRLSLPSRKIVKENCDFWIFPSATEMSYLAPVRAITAIHDLMHRYEKHFPEVGNWREYQARERLFTNICRYSIAILVDSNCGALHVGESFEVLTANIFVQPFLPPSYIYQNRIDGTRVEDYHLPKKYLFYPSQFWPHKNHKRLLRAFARLKEQSPDASLVLSGALQLEYGALRLLTETLDLVSSVHFLGYVRDDDIPDLYRGARALIYPSFFGPTNIPPLEAFAIGCPVAASDVYGMKEQLGNAAVFFDPNSEEQIAEVMVRLWKDDNLCGQLIQKGFAKNDSWTSDDFALRLKSNLRSISAFM